MSETTGTLPPRGVVPAHPVIPRLTPDGWEPAFSALAPGIQLAVELLALDPALVCGTEDVLEMVIGYEKLMSFFAGRQLAALAEFARRPWRIGLDPEASFAERSAIGSITREDVDTEVASALTLSRMVAADRIGFAAQLAHRMPGTAAALEAGSIDVPRARMIAELCVLLDADAAALVESRVLPKVPCQTFGPLKRTVLREVAAADPSLAQQREAQQKKERQVIITPVGDGMATLWALLPIVVAAAIDTAISAAARTMKAEGSIDDGRLMDQLRADALGAPFLQALATGELPDAANTRLGRLRGEPVTLHVTVPASVLLGCSNYPGELAGYGPITADTVRELAPTSRMRRILTDPADGTLLDVGTTVYRPPAALARHVQLRDGSCVLPICNRPAINCDLDHTIPAPQGATADHNLDPFCERHHAYKHLLARCQALPDGRQPGVTQLARGVFRWILPTGREYTTRPQALAPPLHIEMRT